MKTRVIAAAGTLGLAAALFPMVSASAADLLICHNDGLQTVSDNAGGHENHKDDLIEGRDGDAAWIRAHCAGTEPSPTTTATNTVTATSTVTVTATITNNVPGPTVTDTVTDTITNNVPGPTVTDTVTSTVTDHGPGPVVTVTENVPGPVTTVAGPASTVTVAGGASTVTKTVAAAGVAATEAGPSKRLAYTGTSAWEPVGLGAGLLLAGLLLLLGRRTLATERRH